MKTGNKISKELQAEAKAYRKSLYEANPEVKKFATIKNVMLLVLMALILLDYVWKFVVMWQQNLILEENPKEVVKLIYILVILRLAQRSWKGSLLLWLPVAGNLLAIPTYYVEVFLNIDVYWMYSHTFVMMFITELIYIVCIVFTAVWLTLSRKNRRYGEQSGEIEKKYIEYMMERMN